MTPTMHPDGPASRDATLRAARHWHTLHGTASGRGAPSECIEAGDLATDMTFVAHPYSQGIRAQSGAEL
ncbi:cob(I)yrinic acid a,c-diamide adenosyltransferase [Ralstonia solanacearum]|nr:cob(I)yrinic acid a,c-diamide adenosyltransferase [Ralstonia solanacearum]AYB60011.1 cob(I)yrinic acid a c-diamide adenosyltransferase [Ralstonia solanacearum]MBB6586815.1 cob(I)yrinic acid a,c-diamide adenosyltransferase [Ralstonia solanacearum]QJC25758.1 cob(I)yrinic acid a c-diamide adenosyltransferase [Ralstonia solanacearum]